jgi:hypothetical protein
LVLLMGRRLPSRQRYPRSSRVQWQWACTSASATRQLATSPGLVNGVSRREAECRRDVCGMTNREAMQDAIGYVSIALDRLFDVRSNQHQLADADPKTGLRRHLRPEPLANMKGSERAVS